MARSCGIHIDQRRFHVVALDGSPKRSRVVARASGEIPHDEDPVAAVGRALARISKEHALRAESVGLAVDSGLAAFRALTVPFDDRAKIEEIVKFEIESDLPQWNIDDVVVDFLVLSTKPGVESNLVITAVPKVRLERQLRACEKGGLEATTAELDGSALFDAAHASGLLAPDAAHVLVHVGDSSTTVVVADGGRLFSLRAIRAGALPHVPATFEAEGPDDEGEEPGSAVPAADEQAVAQRLAQTARRIRRELARTVAGSQTEHPIEAIYICGHPLAGLAEEAPLDVPVLPLDVLEGGPDGGGGDPENLKYTVAYGAALRALGGGVLRPELRREDLRYSGKFERLELPLAVLSLLLCTLLGVKLIITEKQIDWRDEGNVETSPGDMQHWAMESNRNLLPDPERGSPGRLKNPPTEIAQLADAIAKGTDTERTKFEELKELRRRLKIEVDKLKSQVGVATEFPQPQSALRAVTLVLGVIDGMGDRIGRFGIRQLEANYRAGRRDEPDHVEVRLDVDFFAPDGVEASRNYAALRETMRSQPWCTDFPERPSRPFPDGGGVSFDGLTITVVAEDAAEEDAS